MNLKLVNILQALYILEIMLVSLGLFTNSW
jgi:hypothetical protein